MRKESILALAGVAQAARLIEAVASGQPVDATALETTIRSLYIEDAPTTASVYGRVQHLRYGLEMLDHLLATGQQKQFMHVFRYVFAALYLAGKLKSKKKLQTTLQERLRRSRHQLSHFGADHPQVFANLADIYVETFGHLLFRVKVVGAKDTLSQPAVAEKIRALLLAAIRSGFLFQQLGGRQWHLMLNKGRLRDTVRSYLLEATQIEPQKEKVH